MIRTIAHKHYRNGGFGEQSASLSFDDGMMEDDCRVGAACWVVSDYDRWSYQSLADAKAHYRRIGAQSSRRFK